MAKILLVEDDNNLREIYGERLLAEGYEIVSARDGEEALSVAITEKPDLIISDIMMPKISGFDMLDILRQTPETKDVKIIMMTALSQAEDKARADMLGANKYLVKSQVTLEDVARVVHDILDEPKPQQPTAEVTNVAAPEPIVQPVVPAPVDDSTSSQGQQSDDSTQTNSDDAIVSDDNSQVTDTQEETDSATPSPAESAVNEPNTTKEQQPQPNLDEQPINQPEQPQIDQTPIEDPNQPPEDPIEHPPETTNNLEQNIPDNQDQPQPNVEQPLATETAQESTNLPAEDTQQPQAEQEPTTQQEEPANSPNVNAEPQAMPANPIAQDVNNLSDETTQTDSNEQTVATNGEANSANDELEEVEHQIEDFIANNTNPMAEHQEPLTQPSDDTNKDLQSINNSNNQNQADEPSQEQNTDSQPQAVEPINEVEPPAEPQSQSEVTQPAQEPNEPTDTPKPPVEPANEPQEQEDSKIPPVIPVETTETSTDETRNPEPASVRKKVIEPVHGGSFGTPDINALYQEEMAKEAEENGLANPVANTIVSASTNPIAVGDSQTELPQLETIDASQIPGISTDVEGTAPLGVITPTATAEQPAQQPQVKETSPVHEDPNNPINIAL